MIVPPYTFIATVNAVLMQYALPVFVDVDPDTFQIDASKIEAAITDRTAAILPVHLGGIVGGHGRDPGRRHEAQPPVVEDACQSHLAEWRGRKVGTLGDTGCFSFQVTQEPHSGEGGAILTNDDDLAAALLRLPEQLPTRRRGSAALQYPAARCNLRLTEFQGALLAGPADPPGGTVARPARETPRT